MDKLRVTLNWLFLIALIFCSPGCKKDETVVTRQQDQDSTPPTVSITQPVSGAICRQVDTVVVSAIDNVGVTRVDLYVNSQVLLSATNAPWRFLWNTQQVADGPNHLSAKAYDAAGNAGTSTEITVTVQNGSPVVSLTSATVITSTTLPGTYSFNQQTNYWSVVGLRPPSTADYDLYLYDDSSLTTSLASSMQGAGLVDFVVGDHNHSHLGTYFVRAVQYSGSGSYSIEWEDGNDELLVPGTTATINWGSSTIVKMWDVNLTSGIPYTFTLNMIAGTADPGIALFKSDGAAYYSKRSGGAAVVADLHGNGQGESFTYTPSSSDWYGFVVWTNNAASASFTIQTSQ